MIKRIGFLLLVFGWVPPVLAVEGENTYDRITLDAVASERADNDTTVVTLFYQSRGKVPERVAERVNEAIAWGVDKVKRHPAIKVQTAGYHTTPVYRDGKATGIWEVRQAIRLEGRDFREVSSLLGELQEKLAIQQIGFRLSSERLQELERGLITTAIARFKQKAGLVAEQFGAADYRLVSLNISSLPGRRPVPMMRTFGAMEAKMATAPVIEAGEQEVQINARGVIELIRE